MIHRVLLTKRTHKMSLAEILRTIDEVLYVMMLMQAQIHNDRIHVALFVTMLMHTRIHHERTRTLLESTLRLVVVPRTHKMNIL